MSKLDDPEVRTALRLSALFYIVLVIIILVFVWMRNISLEKHYFLAIFLGVLSSTALGAIVISERILIR
jgi:hypothetical protein